MTCLCSCLAISATKWRKRGMEVDVGGMVVSQYSLLGAHDPAWLTLLPLSSGATIHHDTGVGGRAKIQPAGAIHRDTAQWEIVRHNTVGAKEAWRWPGQGWKWPQSRQAASPLPFHYFLSSNRPQPATWCGQVCGKYTFRSSTSHHLSWPTPAMCQQCGSQYLWI